MGALIIGLIAGAGIAAYLLWQQHDMLRRAAFIRSYTWPSGLLDKLAAHRQSFTRKETALVSQGLRQFFLAYLTGGKRQVAMPSQVADDLWHEFILHTKAYQDFCNAAFGRFLHHTPAAVLSQGAKSSNEGLRRVWFQCCKEENIDPRNATRLPLLFALDAKFNIPGGYRYTPDCEDLRRGGASGTQCGGDFSSSFYDGGTDGFGDGGSGDGGGDGGDGGGGCVGGD